MLGILAIMLVIVSCGMLFFLMWGIGLIIAAIAEQVRDDRNNDPDGLPKVKRGT